MTLRTLIAATALAAAGAASATTLTPQTLAQLVASSDTIVIGRATGVESFWRGRLLYTRYRVAVHESLHGAPGHEVSVVVPGGIDMARKHPIAMVVADAPVLFHDAPVALLLHRSGGDHAIVGFSRGVIALGQAAPESDTMQLDDRRLLQVRAQLQRLIGARLQPAAPVRGAAGSWLPAAAGRSPR